MANSGTSQFFRPLRAQLQAGFRSWVARRIPPGPRITLDLHNIFVLPTRQGLVFLFVLCLMLMGAVNYEASLAYGLVFLLLGLFLLSILHTFRNLAGLRVSGRGGQRVFAGQDLMVDILLEKQGTGNHEHVRLFFTAAQDAVADLIDTDEARLHLAVPTRRRGYLRPGRLVVETRFPLGLCRAWSLIDLDLDCLVYPHPRACNLERLLGGYRNAGVRQGGSGQGDFHGLREYHQGDSLRHVAWKQVARGLGMYTKEYVSPVDEQVWLDWELFPGMATEDRLSHLTWCVLQLDRQQVDYGLRLPGLVIGPAHGATHRRVLLEKLALFGHPEAGG